MVFNYTNLSGYKRNTPSICSSGSKSKSPINRHILKKPGPKPEVSGYHTRNNTARDNSLLNISGQNSPHKFLQMQKKDNQKSPMNYKHVLNPKDKGKTYTFLILVL